MRLRLATVISLACASFVFAGRQEAEVQFKQGEELLARRDFRAALDCYEKAVQADRSWGSAWGRRGFCKRNLARFNEALEDLTMAIVLEPQVTEWRLQRTQCYLNLDRATEAVEDGELLLKAAPHDPASMAALGWSLQAAGEVDRGLDLQTKALQNSGNNPAMRIRSPGFAMKGEWKLVLEEAEAGIAGRSVGIAAHSYRVRALVELGEYDRAAQAVEDCGQQSKGTVYYVCRIYLESTPAAGKHYDPQRAVADAALVVPGTTDAGVMNVWARAQYNMGKVQDCLDMLAAHGRRTNFETMFWLGAAYWKLGQFAEARAVLLDARRLNPYIAKYAEKHEGLKEFVSVIDKDLSQELDAQGPKGRLGFELATHLLTVAEIETFVRRYQFARAVAEYEKLLPTLGSALRKAEVEVRLPEVRGMAGAHAKLTSAVNKAPEKTTARLGTMELVLQKADDLAFNFTIKSGAGRFPWAYLETTSYCELATAQALTPDEIFGLGCLAWDSGERPLSFKLFEEAAKKKAELKKGIATFVARKRGMVVPPSGFVAFRGQYVTAEEKTNLEKGLVLFQGKWVDAKDKEWLAKGHTKIDGKWIPGAEADLLSKGFRKYKDRWMSREEYESLRGVWADAFVEETEHYTIRTNEGEAFAKDLAALAEAGYIDFKAFYGGAEPKLSGKEKMVLHAFRTYEDYRRYCVETKAEDHLNAAGFARSDSNTVVGWNKTSNRNQFLQTMIHEAAHLFYFRVAPMARPKSWYSEAMATYFEGFAWNGKGYVFSHVSESRLPFVRDAMKGKRHIPMKDVMDGNALQLINSDPTKALLFYAECWSINYFLSATENKTYRDAYQQYRDAVAKGQDKALTDFFPDAAKLESDWIQFVSGL